MKTISALSLFVLLCATVAAQSVVDSASIGPGYGNQTWYELQSGAATSASKTEWDIAFELSPQGSSILFNTISGAMLWSYPHSDTSGWASLDTTGIGGWQARWNSDTSWAGGALSNYLNPLDPFDLGWGIYSSLTHYVTGDSLYVVKLANGSYKKLWIRQLATGTYTFTQADLNGGNLVDRSVTKSTYAGKNFVYYSLQNDALLDREPLAANWDLLFTQYTAFIPTPYTVTGAIVNKNYEVAEVSGIADVNTYSNWVSANFTTQINEIGYDWKAYTGAWVIEDSLLYFVRKPSGDVWKLVFTGFGGGGNGNFYFTKELMNPTAVEGELNAAAAITLYPNPSQGRVTLLYDLTKSHKAAQVTVYDLSGKAVHAAQVAGSAGRHDVQLDLGLPQGLYLVDLELDGQHHRSKLVIE